MKPYRIELKRSVLKDIRRFPESVLRRLREAIENLRGNPFPAKHEKIRGYEDHHRIRVGEYRIVYHVATKTAVITIIKMKHRKDVYRQL